MWLSYQSVQDVSYLGLDAPAAGSLNGLRLLHSTDLDVYQLPSGCTTDLLILGSMSSLLLAVQAGERVPHEKKPLPVHTCFDGKMTEQFDICEVTFMW